MKTYAPKAQDINPDWRIVDATDQSLGRLASQVAAVLRGKHKPTYTPHADMGDGVVVLNASKVRVTGNKASQKRYYRHTGYPGGIKFIGYEDLMQKDATKVIKLAVKRMMPRNPLGRAMLSKLKVYTGVEHPHTAQKPTQWFLVGQDKPEQEASE